MDTNKTPLTETSRPLYGRVDVF